MRHLLLLCLFFCLTTHALAQGLPATPPDKVGLSPQGLNDLSAALQAYIDDGKIAGIVALVARHGQVAYFERFGMMDREAGKPMSRDALFRLHSMTKPLTSVAIMMLYEEQQLNLDDPVSQFIPSFADLQVYAAAEAGTDEKRPAHPVTIRHLLMHIAGLTYGSFGDTPVDALYRETDPLGSATSLDELTSLLAHLPLVHEPGTAWTYSLGTDVLARVVEVITGEPFDHFLKHRILEPLEMHDTGFYVPEAKLDRFTALYESTAEGLHLVDAPSTSRYAKPPVFSRGASGLVSTAADYLRFAQMLLNGGELDGVRLLREETVHLMTRNHLPEALIPIQVGPFVFPGQGFGLGVGVLVNPDASKEPGSKGLYWWPGSAHTYFWVDPEKDLIGIVMTQFVPVGRYPLMQDYQRLVYQALLD